MKITDIQSFPLRAELSRNIGFSQWYYAAKNNFIVKVSTDEGIDGWGECYGPNLAIASAIENHFKPLLIGKNPLQTESLWNYMWKAFLDFNRKGIFMSAISGLDIAFWDIKGKKTNLPLRTLLGGTDSSIPCYATGMYFRDDVNEADMLNELLEEATGYIKQGYSFLKIKIGKNIDFDLKLIAAFRAKFPSTQIAADSNHAYNLKEALKVGRLLEKCQYAWFEEPLSPENSDDMALLRQTLDIPIAAGECEQTKYGFLNLAQRKSLDIFQPDIAYCGGVTEFLNIRALASAHHLDVVPHCWGLKINQAVAASAIATLGENPGRFERRPVFLEMDNTEHPVRDSIFSQAHTVEKGRFHFNDLPGLGVEVNEAQLKAYTVDPVSGSASFSQVE